MRCSFRHPILCMSLSLGLLGPGAPAGAAAIYLDDFPISLSYTQVFTDRIGNSRFFANPNTDNIRINAGIRPSPDTQVYGTDFEGNTYYSLNGTLTSATIGHSSFPTGFTVPMTFVGVTSGRGGGLNNFTTLLRITDNPPIQSRLDEFEASPFQINVTNTVASNGPTQTYGTATYVHSPLPFLTDIALIGGGLTPTISWKVPVSTEAEPTNVYIQVRKVTQETNTQIERAVLVHEAIIPLGETSYTFSEPFSYGNIPGFPAGLETGARYEMVVSLERRVSGVPQGRARTFFEFVPLADGAGEVAVFLPSVGPDGVFKFDVEVQTGETIAIDPVVAVGYDYQIGDGDPNFAGVTLPDVGDGLYDLFLFDELLGDWSFAAELSAGVEFLFADGGVNRFRILGIETSAGLDPNDATAFITLLTFTGNGRFTGTMTPITAYVPTPGSVALLLASGLAFGLMRTGRRVSEEHGLRRRGEQ